MKLLLVIFVFGGFALANGDVKIELENGEDKKFVKISFVIDFRDFIFAYFSFFPFTVMWLPSPHQHRRLT